MPTLNKKIGCLRLITWIQNLLFSCKMNCHLCSVPPYITILLWTNFYEGVQRVYFQDAIYLRIPLSLNLTNISFKYVFSFCFVMVCSLYFRPFMHLGILQQQNIYDIIKSHVFYSTNWLNYCVLLTLIRKEKTLLEKDLSFSHLWIQAKISFKGFGKKIRWSDIQP